MANMPEEELQSTLKSIGSQSFSTYDFILSLQKLHSKTWNILVQEYGDGGAGAGSPYSAYSRVAHALNKLSNSEGIAKLD